MYSLNPGSHELAIGPDALQVLRCDLVELQELLRRALLVTGGAVRRRLAVVGYSHVGFGLLLNRRKRSERLSRLL